MRVGDTVRVRSSGRLARIVEELGEGFYEIENLPHPLSDPMDEDRVELAPGIYHARDLEPGGASVSDDLIRAVEAFLKSRGHEGSANQCTVCGCGLDGGAYLELRAIGSDGPGSGPIGRFCSLQCVRELGAIPKS